MTRIDLTSTSGQLLASSCTATPLPQVRHGNEIEKAGNLERDLAACTPCSRARVLEVLAGLEPENFNREYMDLSGSFEHHHCICVGHWTRGRVQAFGREPGCSHNSQHLRAP